MKVDVLGINGKAAGKSVDLPDDIFGVEPNEHVLYLAVKQYLAHQRQGTHKSKERGEIAGSTKKIKKQKGPGTARAGSIKSPIFRGGGRIFGPRPRTYKVDLNKKVKRLARKSALSLKAANGGIKVIEDFTFDAPKTKEFKKVLSNLDSEGRTLMVIGDYDKNLLLSSRNLARAGVVVASDLNTYQIMKAKTLIVAESAIGKIAETFGTK